jgi:hypothetical protein
VVGGEQTWCVQGMVWRSQGSYPWYEGEGKWEERSLERLPMVRLCRVIGGRGCSLMDGYWAQGGSGQGMV